MKLFTVKDIKSSSFGAPFQSVSSGSACRVVAMSMDDKNSLLSRFPSDFEVWEVGEFDETTGLLTSSLHFVAQVAALKEVTNGNAV